jgi:hypothetical protein
MPRPNNTTSDIPMPEPITMTWSDASLGAAYACAMQLASATAIDTVAALQSTLIASIQARETFAQFTRRLDRVMLGGLRIGVRHG